MIVCCFFSFFFLFFFISFLLFLPFFHTGGLGSWFIDQEITSDGKTYIVSEFDPLFLALSILEDKGNGMFKDMNDLLLESATEVFSQ